MPNVWMQFAVFRTYGQPPYMVCAAYSVTLISEKTGQFFHGPWEHAGNRTANTHQCLTAKACPVTTCVAHAQKLCSCYYIPRDPCSHLIIQSDLTCLGVLRIERVGIALESADAPRMH
ncbi:unnamed protein product [Discosporangium mesarthrocarpum]